MNMMATVFVFAIVIYFQVCHILMQYDPDDIIIANVLGIPSGPTCYRVLSTGANREHTLSSCFTPQTYTIILQN